MDEVLDIITLQAREPLTLQCTPTDLVELVTDAARHLQAASDRWRMSVEVPRTRLLVSCDPVRMQRVIEALVGAAMQDRPDGGATRLEVSCEAAAVVRVKHDEQRELGRECCEAFVSAQRQADGRVIGYRLGLAGARAIVEQHGGELSVESTAGHGTTLTVRLPRRAERYSATLILTSTLVPRRVGSFPRLTAIRTGTSWVTLLNVPDELELGRRENV